MFQTFEAPGATADRSVRLARLRAELARRGLDGFLVPRADAHQGEYVPPSDARLAWLTGFTGSAGVAAVLADKAALFVDGRYTLQAAQQADGALWFLQPLHEAPVGAWIAGAAKTGAKIGFDPWLHGAAEVEALKTRLASTGMEAAPSDGNPLDTVWEDRPAPPAAPIRPYPDALAGRSAAEKREIVAAAIRAAGADAAALTLPDSIAWLLNIRGDDLPRLPAPLVFALIDAAGAVTLFLRPGHEVEGLRAHLGEDVAIRPREEFEAAVGGFGGKALLLDGQSAPFALFRAAEAGGARILKGEDPCRLPKAIKTEAEAVGAREAHLRDGAAMARFLCWLDREAPGGGLTEIAIAKRLEAERRATNALMDISFDSIVGSGPNGAIVHYRVTETTDRRLSPGELMLIDSGGQYLDGTTDITRTVTVGFPPEGAVRAFTLVLKAMIAVTLARFPEGTTGRDVDTLARAPLWRAGLDYDHGTGHGVGAYLGVHEGPQSLSRRGTVPLRAGMICSNEPGYYRTGAFGIRIENLVLVEAPSIPEGGERPMLGFETLTLCPVDRRLIDPALLDRAERDWLNAYHARVEAALAPLLGDAERVWLGKTCAAL